MGQEQTLQPCGHPMSAIASSDEGTSYCCDCEANGGTPHPHVPAEANISGECDCETVALVVTERDALKAALREARDFVVAVDYANPPWFEPTRQKMVQSIDTLLGETPK